MGRITVKILGGRRLTVFVAVAGLMTFGFVGVTSSPGSASSVKLTNSEVGVTKSTIRIAVIADVNDVYIPGFGTTTVDGVKAFAKFINSEGGLAGRKVVVDFYDGKLDPATTRNDLIEACTKDFALVGSFSLAMSNVTPMLQCKNRKGHKVGLPDLSALAVSPQEAASKVTYAISPDSYAKAPNGNLLAGVGAFNYFATVNKTPLSGLHGTWIVPSNNPSSKAFELGTVQALGQEGIKTDNTFEFTGAETEAAFGPVITSAQDSNSNVVVDTLPDTSFIALRQEAATTPSYNPIWYCPGAICYSQQFLAAGPVVNNTYTDTWFAPTEESSVVKGVKEYLNNIGSDPVDGFGEVAFAAGLVFRNAVQQVVKLDGPNGVTRANLLSVLSKTGITTADGMLAPTNIGARTPTDCLMLLQDQNDKWQQVYPAKAGTFNCSPSNIETVTNPPSGS